MPGIYRRAHTQSLGLYCLDSDGAVVSVATGKAVAAPDKQGQLKNIQRQAAPHSASSWPVDLKDRILEAAKKYDLSSDPRDYLFDAGRANTATVPNDNHLSFPRSELLKYHSGKRCATYKTYVGAPHHIEHQTDDPRDARGFVLDSHYYDLTPAAHKCPACGVNTRSRANRRADGIQCICGCPVKDEYVAALIAIDRTKDRSYSSAVEQGNLPNWSMGCGIGQIVCSIDGSMSETDGGACKHIRGTNLGRLFLVDSDGARAIPSQDAIRLARAAKLNFCPNDFMELVLERDSSGKPTRRIARAYEEGRQFLYDDLSNVMTGGDRRAMRSETLRAANRRAASHRSSARFVVVRANGDNEQTRAGRTLDEAIDRLAPEEGSRLDFVEVEAANASAARLLFSEMEHEAREVEDHVMKPRMTQRDAEVVVRAPPDEEVVIQPAGMGPVGRPGDGLDPMMGDGVEGQPDLSDVETPIGEMDQMSPSEMGVEAPDEQQMPVPGAPQPPQRQMSKKAHAQNFADWDVLPTKIGTIFLTAPGGVKAARFESRIAAKGGKTRELRPSEIRKSLDESGLVATLERFAGKLVGDLRRLSQESGVATEPVRDIKDAPKPSADPIQEDGVRDVSVASPENPLSALGEPEGLPRVAANECALPGSGAPVEPEMSRENSAPPGMEDTVKVLEKDPNVTNPYAVAWSLYNDKNGGSGANGAGASANMSASMPAIASAKAMNDGVSSGDSKSPINEGGVLDHKKVEGNSADEGKRDVSLDSSERKAARMYTEEEVDAKIRTVVERFRRAAARKDDEAKVEFSQRDSITREAVKTGITKGIDVEYNRLAADLVSDFSAYNEITRVLSSQETVGRDSATGEAIVYGGLHPKMARRLAKRLLEGPVLQTVNHLVDKGVSALQFHEEVLIQREAELRSCRLPEVEITSHNEALVAQTRESNAALEAMETRDRLRTAARTGGIRRVDHDAPRREAASADPLAEAMRSRFSARQGPRFIDDGDR